MEPIDVFGPIQAFLRYELFEIGGQWITPVTITTVGIIMVVTWILSRIVQKGVERAFLARGVRDRGTIQITRRLLHYVVLVIGLGIALETMGLNLAALFAAGAIFAVAIGFAMQTIAQNFVAGLILLIEREIRPGDVVEVDGTVVRLLKMGIRTTVARTRDDEELIIPNSFLVQTTVKNFTLSDSLYRLRALVGVTYDSDMRQVRRVLEEAARSIPDSVQGRDPVVLLWEFADSSVDWQVSIWVSDPFLALRIRSQLHEAIWWSLQEAGITIAFPQLDIHLDPPVERALGRLPAAG